MSIHHVDKRCIGSNSSTPADHLSTRQQLTLSRNPLNTILTIGTHSLPQLERHSLGLQLLLVARLNLHRIRPDNLLDLATLEAHFGLAHDFCLGAWQS